MNTQDKNSLLRASLPQNLAVCGYEKISVTDAAIKTLTVPADVKYCEIAVESGTTTGFVANYVLYANASPATLPSVTDGIPVSHGTVFDIPYVDAINNFRVICRTGITATLHVQYYK